MPRTFLPLAITAASLSLLAGCGGGSGNSSSPNPPTSTPAPGPTANPAPAVSSVTPATVVAGSAAQTFTVAGTGFVPASTVQFNGAALPTTFVNATTLQAQAPASALAAGAAVPLTVTNPSPGGGASPAIQYSISSPTPLVKALSPQSVPQGAAATVTVTGTGFEANSAAQWNGAPRPTTFVNATTLQVALTAADTQKFGQGQIAVNNPGPGGSATTPVELAVLATTPTITQVSPSSVAVNASSNVPQQVFLAGSGFAANATVQANGQSVSVSSQSATSITVALPAGDIAKAGSISMVVTNPGSPAISSNTGVLSVVTPASTIAVFPNYAPAGSPDTKITVRSNGIGGFFADSVVQWNGAPLATKYLDPNDLTATVPAALLTGFVQANVSVNTPEAATQAPAQPFDTFLALPTNDIAWNAKDGLIYASTPGSAGPNLGNSIVAIDPATGVIQKIIFVGSEPNRIALSDDGTTLFAGLNGAGAVRQVDLKAGTAGIQFSLGGGPGVYNPPYNAQSLAVPPGQPNSVAVYGTDGVVTIFDSGVARPNLSKGLEAYSTQNVGALAFNGTASTLYMTSDFIGGYLYNLSVDASGITSPKQLTTGSFGSGLQFDSGRLYVPTGLVLDAGSGQQLGQFSSIPYYSAKPVATVGPIVSDSALGRVWITPGGLADSRQILVFDSATYNPVGSQSLTGVGSDASSPEAPEDLIRWGQNGLAFHTQSQLYVLQGSLVKDVSSSPADLALSLQAPGTATTGNAFSYAFKVANLGQNAAQGVSLAATLPPSLIPGAVQTTQGSCSGVGTVYCDFGSLAAGASATVTLSVTPTSSGALTATASVSSGSYDPVASNNQASASTTVNGGMFSAPPIVTQLSPALVQAGAQTFTLTVDGTGFNSASTVMWNNTALPTTLVNGGQLTASVDASLVKSMGWAQVSVASAAPGGGQSIALTCSIYGLLNVPANAMAYDPFTRKLYAALPSTSASLTGNSIVAVDPAAGSIGSPVQVGSEPNLLSETSDGDYLFVGLSGAKSLGRFNLLTQALDLTVSLPSNANYAPGPAAAMSIAAVPGSDSSLAVEVNSFYGIGILDITGSTATFRKKSGSAYTGDFPVFADPTHFFAYNAADTGFEFYRYSVDADGVHEVDGTTLNGMGGFTGKITFDGGLVYGTGGGIANPATTPPSQVALLPFNSGPNGGTLSGAPTIPDAAQSKAFQIGRSAVGQTPLLARYNTQRFVLEQQIQLPISSSGAVMGLRWGQDGLAYILAGSTQNTPSQIFLLRGPFVLPAEATANSAPSLSNTDHTTIPSGTGNTYVTVSGSGFLPGAVVLWNGAERTTSYVDGSHLRVAIPAADLQSAGSPKLQCQNPGSGTSNTINITVQ